MAVNVTYVNTSSHQAYPPNHGSTYSALNGALTPVVPVPHILFERRGGYPGQGVPLTYFRPPPGQPDMSSHIQGASDIVFDNQAAQVDVQLTCPGYEEIKDCRHRFDGRNMKRATLGKLIADMYHNFFAITLNKRFPSSIPTPPGTGPFGERLEQFNVVHLRQLGEGIWQIKISRNGSL